LTTEYPILMRKEAHKLFVGLALLAPLPAFAGDGATAANNLQIDLTHHWVGYFSLAVIIIAYVAAMFEESTELRKSKPMLLASSLIWFAIVYVYRGQGATEVAVNAFTSNLLAYIQLFLFIMVSMTYLNAMEDMKVFDALRIWLVGKHFSYRRMFWITGVLVFFLSSALNGLTMGLLMGAVVMAVGRKSPKFVSLACINIVIATNAGGSFSPLGGISTLFVWQRGMLGFGDFFNLFIPCVVNFLIPACIMHFAVPKDKPDFESLHVNMQRGAKRVIFLFATTVGLAVVSDTYFHMPAAAGMMAGLSLLQFFTFFLQKTSERDQVVLLNCDSVPDVAEEIIGSSNRYNIFEKVGRLEWDTLLFFYGAMVGIGGLGFIGYLDTVSHLLYGQHSPTTANILIGLSSAFVDNGTLMFAVLSMHPNLPQGQWLLITLTLGVGGSLLAIGSAPGIGLLGQSKGFYTFSGHMKWFPAILLGYFASIGVHFLINARFF